MLQTSESLDFLETVCNLMLISEKVVFLVKFSYNSHPIGTYAKNEIHCVILAPCNLKNDIHLN